MTWPGERQNRSPEEAWESGSSVSFTRELQASKTKPNVTSAKYSPTSRSTHLSTPPHANNAKCNNIHSAQLGQRSLWLTEQDEDWSYIYGQDEQMAPFYVEMLRFLATAEIQLFSILSSRSRSQNPTITLGGLSSPAMAPPRPTFFHFSFGQWRYRYFFALVHGESSRQCPDHLDCPVA